MGASRNSKGNDFARHEVDSVYVTPGDRFVVSLVVGYNPKDTDDTVTTPEQAAAAALGLVLDGPGGDTHWSVYDRETGATKTISQSDDAMRGEWLAHILRVRQSSLLNEQPIEFRCTRNAPYANPNCTGHADLSARQGHYIRTKNAEDAIAQMHEAFPNDTAGFTAHPTGK